MGRRPTAALLALVAMLAIAACGGSSVNHEGATAGATTSATPEAPPFTVQAGLTGEQALDDANLGGDRRFVVDVKSGLIMVLSPQPGATLDVSWRDEGNLIVAVSGQRWLVRPDGSVRPWSATESSAPTPVPTPAVGDGARSPSGLWSVAVQAGDGRVLVYHADPACIGKCPPEGEPVFRLTSAVAPSWPPLGRDLLAFNGNFCSANDIMTFDPATGALHNLTADDLPMLNFVWETGDYLAAFVLDGNARRIDLIDALSGHATPIVSMPRPGELIPLAFSPEGGSLLFDARSTGRDFCSLDNSATPPPPTTVERLAP